MRRRIRLNESSLHRIIKETVMRILNENQNYTGSNDPKFYEYLKQKEGISYPEDMPSYQLRNLYNMYLVDQGIQNFQGDGQRVNGEYFDAQLFKNPETGEIEFHGPGTINGWQSKNSRYKRAEN